MQLVFLLPWCACRGIRLEKYISVWDEWKWCLSWFSAISYQSRLYSCQTHSSFLFVPSFQNNRSSCIAQLCSSDLCDKVLFAQQAWGEDAKVITKPFLVMSVCILESFTHYQSCLSYWLRSTSTHQMLVVRKLPSMLPDGHWSKLTQKACSRFQSTSVSDTVASSGIVGDCSKQSQWLVYPFLATLGIWCCEFNISDRCSCVVHWFTVPSVIACRFGCLWGEEDATFTLVLNQCCEMSDITVCSRYGFWTLLGAGFAACLHQRWHLHAINWLCKCFGQPVYTLY